MSGKYGNIIRKTGVIVFWLVLWQFTSMLIQNRIVFVGPIEAGRALAGQIGTGDFWITIGHTMFKIAGGFLMAFITGILLGLAAYRFRFIKELLEPVILLFESVPVASFVIVALIWIGSRNLSVFISFLVVLPLIYINTLHGFESADRKMLEMAEVFHIRPLRKLIYIYRPYVYPHLVSGCSVALGMCWKSGIAAEVIGVPAHSIGEKLYMAKIYLSTADLFAWTFVIIIISMLFERLFMLLLRQLGK